jgi:hypothetical protein
VPGSAKASPLIRLLLDREMASRSTPGTPHDVLGRRALILFIEWVDLGAQWDSRLGNEGSAP